jgi:hypothetical protein
VQGQKATDKNEIVKNEKSAYAGSRTRVNRLEGGHLNRWTTYACEVVRNHEIYPAKRLTESEKRMVLQNKNSPHNTGKKN